MFFDFKITQPNSYIVPPILRNEILNTTPTNNKHILVYNTTANVKKLIKLLKNRPETFIIYGPNKEKKEGNCIFKKQSKTGFLKDLLSAKAFIASAGLTLMTEAIHLGKPYFALPIKKRIEQLVNAYYLKKLGYGDYSENLTSEDLDKFLKNIPLYKKQLQNYKRSDNIKLYKLLDKLIKKFAP